MNELPVISGAALPHGEPTSPAHWVPVGVFLLCYALFVILPRRRSWIACGGAVLLMLTGALTWREALLKHVNWNVTALFFGTLILAELFMQSRMPAVLAERLVRRTRTILGAMLALCALTSFLSMFLENVAVVLIVAPIALSLTQTLGLSPVRLLIAVAICSNLQGTATLIGDPPSMILAGHMKLSFNDFFIYQGRLSIFFAVQAGAVASMLVLAWIMRRHHEPIQWPAVESSRSFVPSALLLILMGGLSVASFFDPEFLWLAGTWTLVLAAIGLFWHRQVARWGSARKLVQTLDWDTTFFLIGVFILVGALSESGWLSRLADLLATTVGGNRFAAFVSLVALSVLLSGFVDNVPFLLAMIPVADQMAGRLSAPPALLLFGLLIGSCIGGNITPIGASANVVTVGILRRQGHIVRFGEFMRIGIPFTIAAVLAACLVVWFVWSGA
ncbi:MAG: SLC13 family permease [Kiritimatiellia bacterium]|nr:SLC13 family permease [Kiritimatiellia bacterium]